VRIEGPAITLGQLLKLSGLIDSGAEAKAFLRTEQVWVNGEPEMRRGKKLTLGDVVRVGDLDRRSVGSPLAALGRSLPVARFGESVRAEVLAAEGGGVVPMAPAVP
jgi:ribosome-associated protein